MPRVKKMPRPKRATPPDPRKTHVCKRCAKPISRKRTYCSDCSAHNQDVKRQRREARERPYRTRVAEGGRLRRRQLTPDEYQRAFGKPMPPELHDPDQ